MEYKIRVFGNFRSTQRKSKPLKSFIGNIGDLCCDHVWSTNWTGNMNFGSNLVYNFTRCHFRISLLLSKHQLHFTQRYYNIYHQTYFCLFSLSWKVATLGILQWHNRADFGYKRHKCFWIITRNLFKISELGRGSLFSWKYRSSLFAIQSGSHR